MLICSALPRPVFEAAEKTCSGVFPSLSFEYIAIGVAADDEAQVRLLIKETFLWLAAMCKGVDL